MHAGAWLRPLAQIFPHALSDPARLLAAVLLTTWGVALAVSVALRRRLPAASAQAGGAGILAGWMVVVGIAVPPRNVAEGLPEILPVVLAVAALSAMPRRLAWWAALAVIAMMAGWWFAGTPLDGAGLLREAPVVAISAAWMLVLALIAATEDAWSVAASSVALAAALHAAGAPSIWPLLAVAPAAACLFRNVPGPVTPPPVAKKAGGKAGRRGTPQPVVVAGPRLSGVLPAMLAMTLAASGAVAASDQARLHLGAIDAACAAPVVAIWLMARLRRRLGWLGPASGAAASVLTVAVVSLIAFSAAALAGLR